MAYQAIYRKWRPTTFEDVVGQAHITDTLKTEIKTNRLAHAYGDVDREIIWQVIDSDFDVLLAACQKYCEDVGVDLE